MDKTIHIIGHGIAGTSLALTCLRRGIPFLISGTSIPGEASNASSGLIAPVTGRRYVKSWLIDELIPFAVDFYHWTEKLLGSTYFYPVEIVRFLSNDEARKAWEFRSQDQSYAAFISNKRIPYIDDMNRPYGVMTGGYRLDTSQWLSAIHRGLLEGNLLVHENIHEAKAIDRHSNTVIWATGSVHGPAAHGIVPNKGEALIVKMPEWEPAVIIKDEISIVPLANGLYWIGSYYERFPADPFPSEAGKYDLLDKLRKIYSGPIEIMDHLSGNRPTVLDRRPIIGVHPDGTGDYLFNGMGTKGTSLAPYWADRLVSHIVEKKPIPSEVNPLRYPHRTEIA